MRTRFAKLYLTLDDSTAAKPGTFVDVVIDGPQVTDTFVLPEKAEQAGGFVWRVSDGKLGRVEPQILGRSTQGLIVEAFDVGAQVDSRDRLGHGGAHGPATAS